MWKRWTALGICMWMACMALYSVGCAQPTDLQRAVEAGELMRIHILAHDDTQEEQALKLRVRDEILAAFVPRFENVGSAREARKIVEENVGEVIRIAENAVREAGKDHVVRAEVGVFAFPERVYGGQVVPAGEYAALRVLLGEAKGKNWWCVMYPPLCFSGEDYEGEVRFESGILKWWRKRMRGDTGR